MVRVNLKSGLSEKKIDIEILTANIIDNESEIIFPICIPADLSEDDLAYRKDWIESVVSELCEKQKSSTVRRKIEFIIADTLDRHNRGQDSKESIDEDGCKWIRIIQNIIDDLDLTEDEKLDFVISSWNDHYTSDEAAKCIELFQMNINKDENKGVKKYFHAVAKNFAKYSNASDETSALSKSYAYLSEEYGMFLFWRSKYKNPLVVQSFTSNERMKILNWINHIVIDPSVVTLQGRIQSMSFVDVEKYPNLIKKVKKNKGSKSNVNPQHSRSHLSPQTNLMWQLSLNSGSDMTTFYKMADEKMRIILEAGGASALAEGQRECVVGMFMMLQLNTSSSDLSAESVTNDSSPSMRIK